MDKRPRSVRLLPFILVGVVFVAGVGPFFGFWRAALAFAIAAPILALGIGYFRSAAASGGIQDDDVETVEDADIRYVCSVCGLELKVIAATNDKPPTHCREKMELVTLRGKPPLKPV